MVRLYSHMVIFVVPPWLIVGTLCVGDGLKDGSSVVSPSLVSPSVSLVPDPWANVKDFLEEVSLYGSTIGNFCP